MLRIFYRRSGNSGNENLFQRTRAATQGLFVRPKVFKTLFRNSLIFLGPKCFNMLLLEIKNSKSVSIFMKNKI